MCKMQLCSLLCAANTSSLCLAVVDAGILFPPLHHQPGQALLQGMMRWMSFLKGKIVAAQHLAILPTFTGNYPNVSHRGCEESVILWRQMCQSSVLHGWSSQQLLGSRCAVAVLWEKHCGFFAAFQEANLSVYQLRLPYG